MLSLRHSASSMAIHYLVILLPFLFSGHLYQLPLKGWLIWRQSSVPTASGRCVLMRRKCLVPTRKNFKQQANIGNVRIFREYGSRVHFPTPYKNNIFYYVSSDGNSASESKTLTLPQWVYMCNELERFLDSRENLLSLPIIQLLLAYSGKDCTGLDRVEVPCMEHDSWSFQISQ